MSTNCKKIAQAAVASVVASLSLMSNAATTPATPVSSTDVKCYGVAAASKNDCGTVVSACASSIAQAGACYAWIFLPSGICEKIAGSSVGKPAADCKGPTGQAVTK